MRARARLVVELDGGRSVVRELRSAAPLALVPRRRLVHGADAEVYLVSSASTPLGGDDLRLDVSVGPGARLRLGGVAATVALPGALSGCSAMHVHFDIAGAVDYVPEPTVVTARAAHEASSTAELTAAARLRWREVLVLGRYGETPGVLGSEVRVCAAGTPVLHQRLDVGAMIAGTTAVTGGKRVLATELTVGHEVPDTTRSQTWGSRVPLPGAGALSTVLADDVTGAHRTLAELARD